MATGQPKVIEAAAIQPTVVAVAPVVAVGAGPQALDAAAFANLSNVTNFEVYQGKWIMEAATCGCVPNSYSIRNRDNTDPMTNPVLVVEEQSDCCCRCCCHPHQPVLLKFYNVATVNRVDPVQCCCFTCTDEKYQPIPDKNSGAIMTMERPGLCSKFHNCFVCCECCQDEVVLHAGDVGDFKDNKPGTIDMATAIASAKVPILGGGCTPTVNIMDRTNGQENQFAVVEGPMCFGGLKDLLCDTVFKISKQPGKSGDLGEIRKEKPEGCNECCRAMCSDSDTYQVNLNAGANLSAQQKAVLLGEAIHIDYMWFDADQSLCHVERRGNTTYIDILLCLCYCYGCLCPIKCRCAASDKGN